MAGSWKQDWYFQSFPNHRRCPIICKKILQSSAEDLEEEVTDREEGEEEEEEEEEESDGDEEEEESAMDWDYLDEDY